MPQSITITESECRSKAITFKDGQIFIDGKLWVSLNPSHGADVTIVWRPSEPAKEPEAGDHDHYHEPRHHRAV